MVILSKNAKSTNIFNISDLFYLTVKIEIFNNSGPSQCFSCQRFGHSLQNCGHALRCIKCNGNHTAKNCTITLEVKPTCCNCSGDHTANYRAYPYYLHVAEMSKPKVSKPTTTPKPKPLPPAPSQSPTVTKTTSNASTGYASAVKGITRTNTTTNTNKININDILALLMDLLVALASDSDPKIIMATTTTTKSFLKILTTQLNELYTKYYLLKL